jgi:hypothetical protein
MAARIGPHLKIEVPPTASIAGRESVCKPARNAVRSSFSFL